MSWCSIDALRQDDGAALDGARRDGAALNGDDARRDMGDGDTSDGVSSLTSGDGDSSDGDSSLTSDASSLVSMRATRTTRSCTTPEIATMLPSTGGTERARRTV